MAVAHGRRKPLNMLEQPMWPEIRKGPPRFVKAKRTSKVDVGAVTMDVDNYPDTWGHAVLTNSYNANQTKYGKRPNHTTVVNKEFRPPPTDLEDLLPISRGKRQVVFGRINPGGGYTKAQNTSLNQVDGWLKEDERVLEGSIAPTFESPVTYFEPLEEPVLARILPDYSVSAGDRAWTHNEIQPPLHITLDNNIPPVIVHSGFEAPFGAGTPFEVTDLKLGRNHPELSIESRGNTLPVFTPRELPIYEYTLPRAGPTTANEKAIALGFEKLLYDLTDNGPHLEPIGAGYESSFREYETPVLEPISRSNLPSHQKSAGRQGVHAAPAKPQKRYHEARRTLPSTGFYRVPEAQVGTRTPNDLGQGSWSTRHQDRVTSKECGRADPNVNKLPSRFIPSAPQFRMKSDAMRHHVEIPSQRPGEFSASTLMPKNIVL